MISVDRENRGRTKRIAEIDLAACILFYEKLEQTLEFIQSVLPSEVNIYVLNNGSSPSSRQALGQFCDNYKQIKIFDSNINLGVGVGRNFLVTHTTEEWLLFVDNDIVVKTPDWLQRFTQHVSSYNDIEVFIPMLFDVQKNNYFSYSPFRIVGDKVIRVGKITNDLTNNFPGGASFINRKLFDRLGLYDDKMFIGLEEYELSIRSIRSGKPVKARVIHDIKLIHNHRQAAKNEDRNALLVRYNVNHIESSFNRIIEKHNLILEGKWVLWATDATEKILKNDNFTFKNGWKPWVTNLNKRILRRSKEMIVSFASFVFPSRFKMILKRTLHLMPNPHSCSLVMTERCNFECQGCYRSTIGVKKSKEMTLATVQKLLSLYPSLDAFCVAGVGEPTLCPNFIDIVNFLRKSGKYVGIVTNGTNFNEFLKLTYTPNYISIILKGYDNESYLANTSVDAFDTVMETFSKLKEKFNNVGFSYVLNKINYKDLDKVLPLCDGLKPEFLYLRNYMVYEPTSPKEVKKIITVKNTEIIDYVNEICAGRDYIKVKPVYMDFDNQKFNCLSYDYVINIDGDGNIGGCQQYIPPDVSFGNIFTDKDPYNSLEMDRLRNLIHSNSCAHDTCRFCFRNWEG